MVTNAEHTVIQKNGINFPHITANGSHINLTLHTGGLDRGFVVDVKSGESYEIMAVRFEEPYPIANHHMICPTDPTVMFFSHEGTTQNIPDRLWIAKLGEEPYNIAYQKVGSNGKPLDCFGHEFWAPDGKGLYFVKYSCSPSNPKGVCYVSLDDIENPEVLYSKFPYWHVSCSPDQRYIVSDTQSSGFSGVCLIDTETDKEVMLYRAQTYNYTHPGHPHPCVNTESDVVCFNDHNLENGKIAIGFYFIE
jgi:protease II